MFRRIDQAQTRVVVNLCREAEQITNKLDAEYPGKEDGYKLTRLALTHAELLDELRRVTGERDKWKRATQQLRLEASPDFNAQLDELV